MSDSHTLYYKYKKYKNKYKGITKIKQLGSAAQPPQPPPPPPCQQFTNPFFLVTTRGFSQVISEGRFITILGECHNDDPSISWQYDLRPAHPPPREDGTCIGSEYIPLATLLNDPAVQGKWIDQFNYVYGGMGNLLCNPKRTLVLLEIAEGLKNIVVPSHNLEMFRSQVGESPNFTTICSDVRRDVFDLGDGRDKLYMDIIRSNLAAHSLSFDDFIKIQKQLSDFYTEMVAKIKELQISEQEKSTAASERRDPIHPLEKYITSKNKLRVIKQSIIRNLGPELGGVWDESTLRSKWKVKTYGNQFFNNHKDDFVSMQQSVLDINMLYDMYRCPRDTAKNIVMVVGDNHRKNFIDYFTYFCPPINPSCELLHNITAQKQERLATIDLNTTILPESGCTCLTVE